MAIYNNSILVPDHLRRLLRIWLVAAILTVGGLQVTRCSEDDDIDAALRDQHDRMHNMVTTWGGQ